jgi:hypothetical protein
MYNWHGAEKEEQDVDVTIAVFGVFLLEKCDHKHGSKRFWEIIEINSTYIML